jgi:hypothetical protein
VIDAEFDRENHGLIPATAIGRGLEPPELTSEVVKNKNKKVVNFN